MVFILEVVMNKILLSVIFAYLASSLIKMLFNYLAYDKLDFMVFLRNGGMPSSHTAAVTSMSTAVFLSEGVSNLFMVAMIVSTIVISDAVGLRRAVGKQAEVVNQIADEFRYFKRFKTKRLYELLGHTPKQAVAGLVLGIIIANIVFLIF